MLLRLNNSQWLTRNFTEPDDRKSAARDLVLNGRRIVQTTRPLGAQTVTLFNRAGESLALEFLVIQQHENPAAAWQHLFQALQTSIGGVADLFFGDPSDGWLHLTLGHALVEALEKSTVTGLTSRLHYRVLADHVTTVATLPGQVPGSDDPPPPPNLPATIDGGGYSTPFTSPPEAGTIDGGAFTDSLSPPTLTINAGTF